MPFAHFSRIVEFDTALSSFADFTTGIVYQPINVFLLDLRNLSPNIA